MWLLSTQEVVNVDNYVRKMTLHSISLETAKMHFYTLKDIFQKHKNVGISPSVILHMNIYCNYIDILVAT